jgi:hypothetical protein
MSNNVQKIPLDIIGYKVVKFKTIENRVIK